MTNKHIIWGEHTESYLAERGFTRPMVRWLLNAGVRELAPTRPGHAQRWSRRGYLPHDAREAKVVFIETPTQFILVSVHFKRTAAAIARATRHK